MITPNIVAPLIKKLAFTTWIIGIEIVTRHWESICQYTSNIKDFSNKFFTILKYSHTDKKGNIDIPTIATGITAITLEFIDVLILKWVFSPAPGAIIVPGNFNMRLPYGWTAPGGIIFGIKIGAKLTCGIGKNLFHNYYALTYLYPLIDANFNQQFLLLQNTSMPLAEQQTLLSVLNTRGNAFVLQYQNCMKEVVKFGVGLVYLVAKRDYTIIVSNIIFGLIEISASLKAQFWFDSSKRLTIEKTRIHEKLNATNAKAVITESELLTKEIVNQDLYLKHWMTSINAVEIMNMELYSSSRSIFSLNKLYLQEYQYERDVKENAEFYNQATALVEYYAKNALRFIEIHTVVVILYDALMKIEAAQSNGINISQTEIKVITPQASTQSQETRNKIKKLVDGLSPAEIEQLKIYIQETSPNPSNQTDDNNISNNQYSSNELYNTTCPMAVYGQSSFLEIDSIG